jgi:hypothetical protein
MMPNTDAGSDARLIATFMFFAVTFALIGHTISTTKEKTGDVKIILGGMIGTVLLALLAETGETEATFAKGLAVVTLLSSVLVNGTPVFKAIDANVGAPATITPIKKAA